MLGGSDIKNNVDWNRWLNDDKPTIIEQLNKWLVFAKEDPLRQWDRCNIQSCGIKILMRSQTNCISEKCLVIATVCLSEEMQRKGWFKSFLAHCCNINPWGLVVIEDVDNVNLRCFLEKLDCKVLNASYATTYIVNQAAVLALKIKPLAEFSV